MHLPAGENRRGGMRGAICRVGRCYAEIPNEQLAEKIELGGECDVDGLPGINRSEMADVKCEAGPALQMVVFDVVVGMSVMAPVGVFGFFDPEGIS